MLISLFFFTLHQHTMPAYYYIYLLLPLLYFFPLFIFFFINVHCTIILLRAALIKKIAPLGPMPETPVERYEMWFEIIYWQPCNFCLAYMPGRPKGSSAAACCPARAWLPCMGVATQMSRPCPMCPTPSGQEEYHTKKHTKHIQINIGK